MQPIMVARLHWRLRMQILHVVSGGQINAIALSLSCVSFFVLQDAAPKQHGHQMVSRGTPHHCQTLPLRYNQSASVNGNEP
jgi:hypothetical protein